ncbi:DUF465 domain-containing protein [Flavobacterium sp. CYK-55]|uniref:YdcH family protein n=1 Tax=Flavobacterium sp. CYK-55 TaxID=2835529 RepID=UPI001BCDFBE7|nr:DUF465 domain-containing protein [Flavobacterium sp. CYK-55]MBS7787944.1 DUF465 domain-containing protein [Flavobacterium sp. CYK-55]
MEKHDLLHEFPEYQEKIHKLKTGNAHFRKTFDEYHEVEHKIHRINTGNELATDDEVKELKAHLLFLKDDLYQQIKTN